MANKKRYTDEQMRQRNIDAHKRYYQRCKKDLIAKECERQKKRRAMAKEAKLLAKRMEGLNELPFAE